MKGRKEGRNAAATRNLEGRGTEAASCISCSLRAVERRGISGRNKPKRLMVIASGVLD
jgi:hypothetical protein